METIILIIGIMILASCAFLIHKLQAPKKDDELAPQLKFLLDQVEHLRRDIRETEKGIQEKLTRNLEHSAETMQKQFAQSSRIINDVTEKLTKLDETNKQVLNFSEKMQSLENILKNPKQRGILGEYFLENLLGQVLQPNQYKMQYAFKNGEIVDSVIFFRDKIIPIDAKFSLEKYNRIMEENEPTKREQLEKEFKSDLKNRIDETAKYIRPNEDTTDFAFMFIPAEGIYYNLLIYKVGTLNVNAIDLTEYAFGKKVIIVSPTSFFAYLQTVLQGLKALKMEESVKEIVKRVGELAKHLNAYEDHFQRVGKNLSSTVSAYNSAYRELGKVDKDVYKITEGEKGGKLEQLLLDKPAHLEEI